MKTAVIGVGHLGRSHARIYSETKGIEQVGVCDILKKEADEVARQNNTSAFYDYRKLLDRVEAVSIVVPTKLHYKIAMDFIRHKVHVLIEKPITENLSQADKLLKAAKKNNVILQVGHIERFNAAVKALKKIIDKPKFIECHRLGSYQPRGTDVGVVLDLMIHDIDIILHLVKSSVKKLDAVGVSVLSPHEDIANARLFFANKAVCNITASRVSREIVRKIRIFQKNTYISLDYVSQEALIYRKKNGKIEKTSINIQKQEPLKAEIQSFLSCIKMKKRPVVSGEDARLALKTAFDILRKIGGTKKCQKR